MAIAVSLGIDPMSVIPSPRPAPAPTPLPAASTPIERPLSAAPVVVKPTAAASTSATRVKPLAVSVPVRARFSVGTIASWGVSPAVPAFGATIDAGLQRGAWSLDLEGAGDWRTTATSGSVGVSSSLIMASLAPCIHVSIGLGCALVGVGALSATGLVRNPMSGHAPFADAGARIGVEIPFAGRFYGGLHVDGLATITHVTYHLDNMTAWNTPPLSATVGLALGVIL
jgi:hypothetical protein